MDWQLCTDPFHRAEGRADMTNKARLPCPSCGGTWVMYEGIGPMEITALDEGVLDLGVLVPEGQDPAPLLRQMGLEP